MISFKSFVNAIHDAIISADDSLKEKNTGLLDKYFVESNSENDLQKHLDNALSVSKEISQKRGNVTREELQNASKVFEGTKQALKGDQEEDAHAQVPGTLTPKTVVVEFPRETAKGIEYVDVHVPLLTLSPMNMSHIEKAVLKADFDLELVDDEVQLNFNQSRNRRGKKDRTGGSLEITISPQETSEGLKTLIEGYEKALRSQIP